MRAAGTGASQTGMRLWCGPTAFATTDRCPWGASRARARSTTPQRAACGTKEAWLAGGTTGPGPSRLASRTAAEGATRGEARRCSSATAPRADMRAGLVQVRRGVGGRGAARARPAGVRPGRRKLLPGHDAVTKLSRSCPSRECREPPRTLLTARARARQGGWRDNRREGHGVMVLAGGNVYAGEWAADRPEGHGRMEWRDRYARPPPPRRRQGAASRPRRGSAGTRRVRTAAVSGPAGASGTRRTY